MPACRTCTSPHRDTIEKALVFEGLPARRAAVRWNISASSLRRHAQRHLPARLLRGFEQEEASRSADLLGEAWKIIAREARAERTADKVRRLAMMPGGDKRYALRAIEAGGRSRARQLNAIALLGRFRGVLVAAAPEPWLPSPREVSDEVEMLKHLSPSERADLADAVRHMAEITGRVRLRGKEPSANGGGSEPGEAIP